MKKVVLLFIVLFIGILSHAQLLQWNTFGNIGTETTEPSSFNDPGVNSASLTLGTINPASNANRFGGTGWFNTGNTATGNTLSEAIAGNDYIEFIVTAAGGYKFTPTSFAFSWDRSGTGPQNVTLRSSADGFASDLGSVTAIATGITSNSITISGITDITGSVTFRLYGYGATSAAGTGGFDVASNTVNVQLNGTATATGANTITTGAVSSPPFCVTAANTSAGTVAYSSTGVYSGATFSAELSDASGSFSTPVVIGTSSVSGTNPSGTISITIPAGTATGNAYAIRVVSNTPSVTGTNSTAFSIYNGAQNVTALAASFTSSSATVSWTNPPACYDEVMVVVKAASSITGAPTGDGSAYTADLNFQGSGSDFDGGKVVYKGASSPQTITNLTTGSSYYIKVFTRRGTNWSSGVEVSGGAYSLPAPGNILINQLSPDYGAPADEFVELVNTTNQSFNLSTLQLKYQSASGSNSSAGGVLSGVLLPHHYWLLSPNGTVTVGQTNLVADGTFSSGFATASGQIALVRISDNTIIDGVGWGTITSGTFTEGTAAATPPTDGAIKRVTDGADANNNASDFTTVVNANILLRNSSSFALPVKFNNVKAFEQNSGIVVQWSNATEENVAYYNVERSANGREFSSIAQIDAKVNDGGKADYKFFDNSPLNDNNYYRIKAVETTGKAIYSLVVKLSNTINGSLISVYPNPVKNKIISINLSNITKGEYTCKLFSATGQQVMISKINHAGGSSTQSINLPQNLSKGIYKLFITNGEKTYQQSLIID